jgi:multimeric flavodoxin WrbA
MKVTAIIGSPHKNGNTAVLAREVLRGLKDNGIETEEIFLPDHRIEYCRGCIGSNGKFCMNTGRCVINDGVNELRDALCGSDGIILASPTYGRRPYAMMKNFIADRIGMYAAYTSLFEGKYFAGLSTGGAIGVQKVAKDLSREFSSDFHARSYVSGYLGVNVGHKRIEDIPIALKKAHELGGKMSKDMKSGKSFVFQRLFARMMFGLFARRIILANIYSNKDGQLKAVYENLVDRKLIKPA